MIVQRRILEDIPQEVKSMKRISLMMGETSTAKLGYLIFGYPVVGSKNYLLFRRVSDSQDDKRILFLGEYNSLRSTIYWIKEDLYTRG